MANVVFSFQEHASEENQDLVCNQILELPGVRTVGRILPQATRSALRRQWYADVADDKAASDLVKHLREHSDIESADLPIERHLS
jgi:hypothetical protein